MFPLTYLDLIGQLRMNKMKKLINLNGKLIEEMSQEEYMDTFLNCVDYIQVYHNVLSKDECKYFINQHTRLSKKGLSKEGTVNGGFQESRYDKKKKEKSTSIFR